MTRAVRVLSHTFRQMLPFRTFHVLVRYIFYHHICLACLCLLSLLHLSSAAQANDSPHQLAHDADIYLVPVGPVPVKAMQDLAQRYRDITYLKVETVGQLPLPDDIVNPIRKQLIAEKLHELMAKVFGNWQYKPFALVIGVTPYDMYIADSDWRYAYAYGQGHYALVSAARMSDAESTDTHWSNRVSTRVQKMMDKRIAIQLFGMGTSRAMPEVLARPVMGPDDLDRIDAQALTDILAAASRTSDKTARPTETQIPAIAPAEPPMPWAILLAFAVGAILIIVLIYRLAKKAEIADLEEWRIYAKQNGWRFTLHKGSWLSSISFSLDGELDDAHFSMRWYTEGAGKNIQHKTQLWLDIAIATPIQVSPRGLLSWVFKRDRIKNGHRLYDCRFLVQTSDVGWRPTDALCQRHLSMPVHIQAQDNGLHLIHSGRADRQEAASLIELAKAWAAHINGKTGEVSDQTESTASAMPCWISKITIVAFWVGVASSVPLLFLIQGEETNLPWDIAWKWLSPIGLIAWLLWVHGKKIWRRRGTRLIQGILVPLFVGVFIWGLAGVWVFAWNAVSGEANSRLVIGLVTDMRETSGKGGPSYFIEFRDATEQRNVEIQTTRKTYDQLRVGDPVGFDLRMGGLGMYHIPSPTLDSIRSWLNDSNH